MPDSAPACLSHQTGRWKEREGIRQAHAPHSAEQEHGQCPSWPSSGLPHALSETRVLHPLLAPIHSPASLSNPVRGPRAETLRALARPHVTSVVSRSQGTCLPADGDLPPSWGACRRGYAAQPYLPASDVTTSQSPLWAQVGSRVPEASYKTVSTPCSGASQEGGFRHLCAGWGRILLQGTRML